MTQATTKNNGDGGGGCIENDQYNFWGGNKDDPWDALHAHFEREARRNGGIVEESTTTGKASPAK